MQFWKELCQLIKASGRMFMKKSLPIFLCSILAALFLLSNLIPTLSHGGTTLTANPATPRKLELDRRIKSGADYAVQSIIAERRSDGKIFLEIISSNIGSLWGQSDAPLPVYAYASRKVGEALLAPHGHGVNIVTTRAFPHDRRLRIRVKVDAKNSIAEVNEANNSCTIELAAGEMIKSKSCH